MNERIAVLVPHAGDHARLRDCLNSLDTEPAGQIRVVLPASASDSRRELPRHERVAATVLPELLPFARATNLAARGTMADLLLLLNDDTRVEPGALDELVAFMDANPRVGIVGPRLLNDDGTIQPSVYADPSWRAVAELVLGPLARRRPFRKWAIFPRAESSDVPVAADWLSGAALMIRRSFFEAVGALDEDFPHGLEDAALCRVARERRTQVVLVPSARVIHTGGSSGFRHRTRPDAVARALTGGYLGWTLYWRRYRRSGPLSCALLKVCFVVMAIGRLSVLTLIRLIRPADDAVRLRALAYRAHLRAMGQGRVHGAESA